MNFEHTYAESLPGFYIDCEPAGFPHPDLLKFNEPLAHELGFVFEDVNPKTISEIFSGNRLPEDARPISQAYAGHQFGSFTPQLGDGRALLLGEVVDTHGRRRDIALKGSGRTPFSRGGDGKAAVGPVLREYLIGESMHALGIPTTRVLAAVATGEPVMRERPLPGAVLTRVASSHVRVGTFQFFAARQQVDHIQLLADYVIDRHDPDLRGEPDRYLRLLDRVAERQAALIAQWMLVGFIHGVMNTDNMAISGETIDYGPCAFMESYNPKTVFSSIDHGGRYAYTNQPMIALWNLTRFAETLVPIVEPDDIDKAIEQATECLEKFLPAYERHWYDGAARKLGLQAGLNDTQESRQRELVDGWFQSLEDADVDFTLAWRRLADAAGGNERPLMELFNDHPSIAPWLKSWRTIVGNEPNADLAESLRANNPIHIPRNHLVEHALADAVNEGDLTAFEELLDVLQDPFREQPGKSRFAEPASVEFTSCYQTFCGT